MCLVSLVSVLQLGLRSWMQKATDYVRYPCIQQFRIKVLCQQIDGPHPQQGGARESPEAGEAALQ